MTPTVLLLLLSTLTVPATPCGPLDAETATNFQQAIRAENETGFPQVFPKDYAVSRHFNPSMQCPGQSVVLCIADKKLFGGDSLLSLCKQSLQETPDPSLFPYVNSSPGTLLTLTYSLLSKWLELNCPTGDQACVLHPPLPPKKEEGNVAGEGTFEDLPYEKEGERGKRWVTVIPTNGGTGLSKSLGLLLCALSSLRMVVEFVV